MAEITAVVPSEGVKDTGRISFKFLIDADVSYEVYKKPFGLLSRHKKPDNYIDPFRLARGEAGAVGDDGVPRWAINLFSKGYPLLAGVVDDPGLEQLLENTPDCVVLVPPADIEPIEVACNGLGHTLSVLRYEGTLTTS